MLRPIHIFLLVCFVAVCSSLPFKKTERTKEQCIKRFKKTCKDCSTSEDKCNNDLGEFCDCRLKCKKKLLGRFKCMGKCNKTKFGKCVKNKGKKERGSIKDMLKKWREKLRDKIF